MTQKKLECSSKAHKENRRESAKEKNINYPSGLGIAGSQKKDGINTARQAI
jgi:hypothetical protein